MFPQRQPYKAQRIFYAGPALESVHDITEIRDNVRMCKKQYPSDISREQFEQIRPLLEGARKRTKSRTVDLYEAWGAVLYLLKRSCQ